MGRRVLLSHFTCSGYRTHCHLLVPLNYSVALFFYLKCSPFLISIILYPQESLNIVSFHLWGSQTSFSPTEMHLLKAVSEHLDWESVGARAKGKGQRMSCSLKKVLEYHKAASWLRDAYWPLEYLCQNWRTHPWPQSNAGMLCVLTCGTPTVGWRMWLLIHTLPLSRS